MRRRTDKYDRRFDYRQGNAPLPAPTRSDFSSSTRRQRTIKVEPGALVGEIKRTAAAAGLLFAPDPTSEEESTIGGAIACNASGARTFKYGATRRHVRLSRS